jgi:hypothetical protein
MRPEKRLIRFSKEGGFDKGREGKTEPGKLSTGDKRENDLQDSGLREVKDELNLF